ncbi:nucleoid occlusion protein [Vallitalea okinawensis]|uniref:nucleoid occlusion protein n=1 Tax=Vallitalea okinawensis TaxID=2078660 RepID=UPI000CFCD7D1|nr:nucleoid occlusion protein [Vallitalea okinawensis]
MSKDLKILNVSLDRVRPNPYQPRRVFDQVALNDLANSIREYGVMQPISIRQLTGDSYELIAGERRLRASKMVGLDTIPAVLVEVIDQDSAVLALIENLQRENLNYFEEAEGFVNLISDYGMTQEDVAKKVGKSQSTIANKVRLLKLSSDIRKEIAEHQLTERHARALLKLPNEELQIKVIKMIADRNLNVAKTEDLIGRVMDDILDSKEEQGKQKRKIRRFIKDIRLFTNTVEKAVDVMKDSGVDINYDVNKGEDFYEISIKIPVN